MLLTKKPCEYWQIILYLLINQQFTKKSKNKIRFQFHFSRFNRFNETSILYVSLEIIIYSTFISICQQKFYQNFFTGAFIGRFTSGNQG